MSATPDLLLPLLHKRGPTTDAERAQYPTLTGSAPADFTDDEDEFIVAVSRFRSVNKINCPTLCQLLWIVKQLGYSRPSRTSWR